MSPRWTKYERFLETNNIPYRYYDIDSIDWLNAAQLFDIVIGLDSAAPYYLEQIRRKFYFIEHHLNKLCYPTYTDVLLFEDKFLEAYLCTLNDLPFIRTHIYHNMSEALYAADSFTYPLVAKIVPGSGSMGVTLLRSRRQCISVIKQAFSKNGRRTHVNYARQKGYVYFQEYIPNDGYDIRIIAVGDYVFGYYRKAPLGDFRASGGGIYEKRELPLDAMQIARRVKRTLNTQMIVVDLLRALNGDLHIIELSPICRIDSPEQLHVDGQPGAYIFSADGEFAFQEGRFWVHELALKEFFLHKCILPALKPQGLPS